jgi:hypothetical protein
MSDVMRYEMIDEEDYAIYANEIVVKATGVAEQ